LFGQAVTLVAIVSATTAAVQSGSVTFTIDGAAQSPVPLALVNGQDQATLATRPLAVGTQVVTVAYSGDNSFHPSASAQGALQIVAGADGPRITMIQRFSFHMMPTTLVLTLNDSLDPTSAERASNYRIVGRDGR